MIRGHKNHLNRLVMTPFENQKSACYDQLKLTAFFIGQPAIICCPFAWLLIYRQAARLFARPWLNPVLEKIIKVQNHPKIKIRMWSYCRFKGGSRGFAVGGFPNFSLVIFTQNTPKPKLCLTDIMNKNYLIYWVINGLCKFNIYRWYSINHALSGFSHLVIKIPYLK